LTMGDRIAVLKDGVLQQLANPREMYDTPQNVFVAGFIGSPAMNLGSFSVEDGNATLGGAKIPLTRTTQEAITDADKGEVTLGFRPEALDVVSEGADGSFAIDVNLVEELGSDAFVYGELANRKEAEALGSGEDDSEVIVRVDPRTPPMKGDRIHVMIREGQKHVCSSATGDRLPEYGT